MLIFSWLLFLPVGITKKISTSENQILKEECGDRFLRTPFLSSWFDKELASIGERVQRNEYPFVAAFYVELKKLVGDQDLILRSSKPFCSGALISRRHIMTAAHCFAETTSIDQNNIVVTAGSSCADPGQCLSDNRLKSHKIDKVIVHPKHTSNPIANDVAIVALDKEVSMREAKPICMPTEEQKVSAPLVVAGFGLNESMTFPGLQMVKYSWYKEKSGYIETVSESQSVCRGDSGSPLFQSNDKQKLVLMGITSAMKPDCTIDWPVRINYFMDVRKHVDWICDETGVCPVNAKVEEQTTTSPRPESSTAASTHELERTTKRTTRPPPRDANGILLWCSFSCCARYGLPMFSGMGCWCPFLCF
ncbi:hypothetical protein Y032_0015g2761 [Ancylostoma ceylanicum]|uniref:Peptidase S1 domain-containing protein n=1 Tax=Ancylostoma ceylanicum TaxID=53326 RepID=A0A016V7M7_9BILA|nr:hypothetical protein Y032_0015g2761 [Ancylostoma ceylanicum]